MNNIVMCVAEDARFKCLGYVRCRLFIISGCRLVSLEVLSYTIGIEYCKSTVVYVR